MSVSALIRCASRARVTPFARQAPRAAFAAPVQRAAFSVSASRFSGDVDAHDPHHEESFEEFTARYADLVLALLEGNGGRERCNGWRRVGDMEAGE